MDEPPLDWSSVPSPDLLRQAIKMMEGRALLAEATLVVLLEALKTESPDLVAMVHQSLSRQLPMIAEAVTRHVPDAEIDKRLSFVVNGLLKATKP